MGWLLPKLYPAVNHVNRENTIVILNQASGYLQIDMLEAYLSKYNDGVIIAGSIVERGTYLPSNVKWRKIMKYDRSTAFKRVFTWFFATMQMLWIVSWRYRKSHIVAITNPPFSIYVPWILGVKNYDIIVYDAYPDALVNFGFIKQGSVIYRIWSWLNEKAFHAATNIFTLTNGMKDLVSSYTDVVSKVHVVQLWSDASDFKIVLKYKNEILTQTNSNGKFC